MELFNYINTQLTRYTVCPTRYWTRHWRYCNKIRTGVCSLCEKWRGMCL